MSGYIIDATLPDPAAPSHADWRPDDQPAPYDFEVQLYKVVGTDRRGEIWLSGQPSFVATEEKARRLVAEAGPGGGYNRYLRRTKVSPGPIGRWMFALRSHPFDDDPKNQHLEGYCLECSANYISRSRRTLSMMEDLYHVGRVGQDEWEGYTWAWATGAARFGDYPGWETPPFSHTAREFGERLRELAAARQAENDLPPIAL
jgi:hypothetical protein